MDFSFGNTCLVLEITFATQVASYINFLFKNYDHYKWYYIILKLRTLLTSWTTGSGLVVHNRDQLGNLKHPIIAITHQKQSQQTQKAS